MNLKNDLKNTVQRIWHAVLCAMLCGSVALGCGSPDAGTSDDDELGQVQEPISAPRTSSYVMGASQSQAAPRCTPSSVTQVCNVPTTRVMKYCLENLTGREPGWANQIVLAGDSSHHFTWTLNPATGSACDSALTSGAVNVMINAANNVCAAAGASNANIDSFVCVNPTVTTAQLSETPSVPGSFFGINGGIVHIDRGRLPAFFPSIPQQDEVAKHGVVHAGLILEGIGSRSDANAIFLFSRRATLPLTGANGYTLTTGENCTLANYSSVLSPGIYAQDSTSCSTD